MELTHAGKKGLCVKTSMIYRMILDKSGARRCQIWVKTPEAAQVTSLGGESRRCCCCCTNRSTFLCEVAFKFLYLYDFTRDKLLLRMLEQTNEFSWYEFVIKNSLFVRIVDFVKTIWLDIEFAKAKFVCLCRIPWTAYFFPSDQDWKYRHMSRKQIEYDFKKTIPPLCVGSICLTCLQRARTCLWRLGKILPTEEKKMTSSVLLNTHFYIAK